MAGEAILLVEDDLLIQDALSYSLGKEGFKVIAASSGEVGLKIAHQQEIDLILLDLMLPIMSGLEVCREVRRFSAVPILIVTAKGEETDRIVGLELGADDYIVKPYSTRELVARIRANLRRYRHQAQDSDKKAAIVIGDIIIDRARREVTKKDQKVHLSFQEFELLLALMEAKGAVVSRDELLARAWGQEWVGGPKTLDVHVRWLREKLEADPTKPQLILTSRGLGYRMLSPEERK